ncbi:MAG: DUF4231 domain-containing protein [Pseudonocardiaceae bacterium]
MTIAQTVWDNHRKWSGVAGAARRHLDCWRLANLALLAAGALGAAVATQSSWPSDTVRTACGALGAGALVLAGVVQQGCLGKERVLRWTTARAASEALKAETFRYLAGVEPYTDSHGDAELIRKSNEIQTRSADFIIDFDKTAPDGKSLPAVQDLPSYVTMRAQDQERWHSQRVEQHSDKAKYLRGAELAATALAFALATAATQFSLPDVSAWVGFATTLGAAIAAHLAATQHDRIAASYCRTTVQLRALLSGFTPDAATPAAGALFVRDVEGILAAQNEGWVSLLSS